VKVVLRPVGRGGWRPLVLEVQGFPRKQGYLFHKDDGERELVKQGDRWVIDGREFRVAEVRR
jgi:hypothetical protein